MHTHNNKFGICQIQTFIYAHQQPGLDNLQIGHMKSLNLTDFDCQLRKCQIYCMYVCENKHLEWKITNI